MGLGEDALCKRVNSALGRCVSDPKRESVSIFLMIAIAAMSKVNGVKKVKWVVKSQESKDQRIKTLSEWNGDCRAVFVTSSIRECTYQFI